jgi:hypothetical protein
VEFVVVFLTSEPIFLSHNTIDAFGKRPFPRIDELERGLFHGKRPSLLAST